MKRYEEPLPMSRQEVEAALSLGSDPEVCSALISATLHDQERSWVEGLCEGLAGHSSPEVRGLVATCLGHIARLHRQLDLMRLQPVLERLASDLEPSVRNRVEDALDDLETFLGVRPQLRS